MKDMTLHINFPKYDTFWADAEKIEKQENFSQKACFAAAKTHYGPRPNVKSFPNFCVDSV